MPGDSKSGDLMPWTVGVVVLCEAVGAGQRVAPVTGNATCEHMALAA